MWQIYEIWKICKNVEIWKIWKQSVCSVSTCCPTTVHFLLSACEHICCRHQTLSMGFLYDRKLLCSAVLCCVLLCFAVLCCVMLCDAMLLYCMLCYAMLCYLVLWYAIMGCSEVCNAMLCCYVMQCFAMLCNVCAYFHQLDLFVNLWWLDHKRFCFCCLRLSDLFTAGICKQPCQHESWINTTARFHDNLWLKLYAWAAPACAVQHIRLQEEHLG